MGHAAEISASLSQAERFRRMEAEFDEAARTRKIYTKGSEQLQSWVKRLWYEYCQMTGKDAHETLREMPIAVVHSFFYWLLEQRCETLRSASTLQTYWNTFCIIRKIETGCVMVDPTIKSQMCGVRQRLAQEFRLQTEKRPKPIMRAEDEFELLKTLWTSPEFTLDHERLRVQLALILQLAGITGNRPGALLGLRYEHLKLTLLRDPAGSEWPRLLIELTFKHTKGYLGLKDANTFGIPDVPREPCLLLCPQILLLSLVFADEAFAAPGLTGPEELFRLRVPAGLNQLELPIKDSKTGVPLFRRLENTVHGVVVSAATPATDNWLRGRLSTLGAITGFEHVVKPYCFRRGNGEALDSSSLISDAQRNLILQHASSAVFQHNYLSRYITQDTHAIYRGLAPQTDVMRAASGMTRTIDPRRPRALNEIQVAQIARHPEVKLLHRTRKSLVKKIRAEYGTSSKARGTPLYEAYQRVDRQHQNKRKAVYKIIMAEILQRYRKQRSAMDIASQLECLPIKLDEKTPSKVHLYDQLSEERNRAVKALFTFATSDPVEECRRRANAVNAVSALSRSQKSIERKVCRTKAARIRKHDSDASMDLSGEVKALQDPCPIECAPTQCIFCIGKADLHIDERMKTFRNRDGLKRHFHRKHLRHYAKDQPISCPHPKCHNVKLANLMHLQNHAAIVHKTMT